MLVPTVLLIRHLDPQVAKQAWDSAAGALVQIPKASFHLQPNLRANPI